MRGVMFRVLSGAVVVAAVFAYVSATGLHVVRAEEEPALEPLSPGVFRDAIDALVASVDVYAPDNMPRVTIHRTGAVRFFAPPPGSWAIVSPDAASLLPEDAAAAFLDQHAAAFEYCTDNTTLTVERVTDGSPTRAVRFAQFYADVPVLGSSIVVHLDDANRVSSVMSDLMSDSRALDQAPDAVTPAFPAATAREYGAEWLAPRLDERVRYCMAQLDALAAAGEIDAAQYEASMRSAESESLEMGEETRLVIVDPGVLGKSGVPRLAWEVTGRSEPAARVNESLCIDAHSGEVIHRYPRSTGTLDLGSLQVAIHPAGARGDGAQWRLDNRGWQDSMALVTGVYPQARPHTVTFSDVPGWITPESLSVEIARYEVKHVSATYQRAPGKDEDEDEAGGGAGCAKAAVDMRKAAGIQPLYEAALPATRGAERTRIAGPDSPLAVRLRSDSPIDPDTVWGEAAWAGGSVTSVRWSPVGHRATDGWVVCEPEHLWPVHENVVVTAGGMTVDGEVIDEVSIVFEILPEAGDAGRDVYVDETEPGRTYRIGPDTLYAESVAVWLPLPAGLDAKDVQVWYHHTEAGWEPAEQIEGWLAGGDPFVAEFDGVRHIGLRVNHGAEVQVRAAAATSAASVLNGGALLQLGTAAALFLLASLGRRGPTRMGRCRQA